MKIVIDIRYNMCMFWRGVGGGVGWWGWMGGFRGLSGKLFIKLKNCGFEFHAVWVILNTTFISVCMQMFIFLRLAHEMSIMHGQHSFANVVELFLNNQNLIR